jgi:hypothetical protein
LILVRRIPGEPDLLFDTNLRCLEDADYSMRLALKGPLDFVAQPLVKLYRNDGGPHVWNAEAAVKGYEQLGAKYGRELDTRPFVRSYYEVCMARDLARLGRIRECRQRLKQALLGSRSPIRLRAWYFASLIAGATGVRAAAELLPIGPPNAAQSSFLR